MCDKWYKLLYACMNACFKINAWESCKMHDTWQACVLLRAFHSGRDMGGGCPLSMFFLTHLPHQSQCPTMGHPIYKWSPHWKVNPSFGKWSLGKKNKKKWKLSLILVFNSKDNTAEISQKRDFLIWSIQNLVGKVKLFENIILLN